MAKHAHQPAELASSDLRLPLRVRAWAQITLWRVTNQLATERCPHDSTSDARCWQCTLRYASGWAT